MLHFWLLQWVIKISFRRISSGKFYPNKKKSRIMQLNINLQSASNRFNWAAGCGEISRLFDETSVDVIWCFMMKSCLIQVHSFHYVDVFSSCHCYPAGQNCLFLSVVDVLHTFTHPAHLMSQTGEGLKAKKEKILNDWKKMCTIVHLVHVQTNMFSMHRVTWV